MEFYSNNPVTAVASCLPDSGGVESQVLDPGSRQTDSCSTSDDREGAVMDSGGDGEPFLSSLADESGKALTVHLFLVIDCL